MKKIDIARISFTNFGRRKTRSILSVLGVVIGTASIVVMVSLGIGMNESFNKSLEEYGNMNQIYVYAGFDSTTNKRKPITDETVAQLGALDHVKAVTPTLSLSGKVFSGKYQNYNSIMGIDMDYLEALGAKIDRGRMPTAADISTGKDVYCVMGASYPYQFEKPQKSYSSFGYSMGGGVMIGGGGNGPEGVDVPEGGWAYGGKVYDEDGKVVGTYPPEIDPLDEDVRIKYTCDWSYGESNPGEDLTVKRKAPLYNLKTLGILKSGSDDYSAYIDIDTAVRLKKEADKWQKGQSGGTMGGGSSSKEEFSYDQMYVLSDDIANTLEIIEQIKGLGFQASGSGEWILQQQQTQGMLQMVLAGIGGVAMLVAAISIANTMIMSIYERTREIGIMKVIGCYLKDIRTMFLAEASFIGLFGGLAGIGLSYGISALLNWATSSGDNNFLGGLMGMGMGGSGGMTLSVIPFWLALLAVAFAIVVALISGFFPARRAMRLSALEAMKN